MKRFCFISTILLGGVFSGCSFDPAGLSSGNTSNTNSSTTLNNPHNNTNNTSCHACTQGEERCYGNSVSRCQATQEGCTRWVDAEDCTLGNALCVLEEGHAECRTDCPDDCWTEGETRCADDKTVEECVRTTLNGEPCLSWQGQPCQEGMRCKAQSGVASCQDCMECPEEGVRRCTADLQGVESCVGTEVSGCTVWESVSCGGGQRCDVGTNTCVSCASCTAGERSCSDDLTEVLECVDDGEGCTRWQSVDGCDPSQMVQCVPNGSTASCVPRGDHCLDPFEIVTSLPYSASVTDFFDDYTDDGDFLGCFNDVASRKELFLSLQLRAQQTVQIRTNNRFDSMIKVLDGSLQCTDPDVCLVGRDYRYNEKVYFEAPADGEYLFVVEAYEDHSPHDSFDLSVSEVSGDICAGEETEPNDSTAIANPINTLPTRFCTRLYDASDLDCMTVTIPQGQIADLRLQESSAFDASYCPGNTYTIVTDSSDTVLAESRGLWNKWCDYLGPETHSALAALPSGVYTICQEAPEPSGSYNNVGYSKTGLYISKDPPTTLLAENFGVGNQFPSSWSRSAHPADAPEEWAVQAVGGNGSVRVHTSDSTTGQDTYYRLVTPPLDFSSLQGFVYLTYVERAERSPANRRNIRSRILISTDNLQTRHYVASFSHDANEWQEQLVNLTRFIGLYNVQIIFEFIDGWGGGTTGFWELDDIAVMGE